jgi:hypothetical protein
MTWRWRERRRSRRLKRVIDTDPLDAIGDEMVKKMGRRVTRRLRDAGILPSNMEDRPNLYVIRNDITDPLEAIGQELLLAARRKAARHSARERRVQRLRHHAVVAATFLFGLAGVAGASAVIAGTTGVPVLDEILNTRRAEHEAVRSSGRPARPGLDSRIGGKFVAKSVSRPIGVPSDGRTPRSQVVAYQDIKGPLCFASIVLSSGGAPRENGILCQPLAVTSETLRRADAFVAIASANFVSGFAKASVTHLAIKAPGVRLAVRLSKPWNIDGLNAKAIRTFVAFPASYFDGIGSATPLTGDLRRYRVRAR